MSGVLSFKHFIWIEGKVEMARVNLKKKKSLATCVHQGRSGDRRIVVVNGMAFYQSTGSNSQFKNVWFPFFGISDGSVGLAGWFIKPSERCFYETFQSAWCVVKPEVDIDSLTWQDMSDQSRSHSDSVLLLQATPNGLLKARYILSSDKKTPSVVYGACDPQTFQQNFYDLFEDKKLLSYAELFSILSEKVTVGGNRTVFENIRKKICSLHENFYEAVFDGKLMLPYCEGEHYSGLYGSYREPDEKPADRLVNWRMLAVSHKLGMTEQDALKKAMEAVLSPLKSFVEEEEIELESSSETFGLANMFTTPSLSWLEPSRGSCEPLNMWIRAQGGLTLSGGAVRGGPHELFKRFAMLDRWVRLQILGRQPRDEIRQHLQECKGGSLEEAEYFIGQVDTLIHQEIKNLASDISKEVFSAKKDNRSIDLEKVFPSHSCTHFMTLDEKNKLKELAGQKYVSAYALLDRLVQFFLSLCRRDRISVFNKSLKNTFFPAPSHCAVSFVSAQACEPLSSVPNCARLRC
ncbi:MAG: hypothetical protein HY939_06450 [Gammaproteobacteria bacterium]|nr:hypothetical protein [Gammaproteobacteria bacterium]